MLEGFFHLFSRRPAREVAIDIFDLIIVTWAVYRALLVLRGTRAMQMGTGLGVITVVYFFAKWAGLVTLLSLLSNLLASIILIVVVVFQNDIRRGLMRVGSQAFFGGIARQQESKVIDEVVASVTELARHRMGALICFEQDANLDEFVAGQGTVIDAVVRRELLVSLFIPESVNKLHDGAVVIRNLRIAKAGVFFPMPEARGLDKSLGTRHRAALGITEETDAVVVVVSEERGTISFCFNGNIVSNLDGSSLRQALSGLFGQRARKRKRERENRNRGNTLTMRLGPPGAQGTTATSDRTGGIRLAPPTGRDGDVKSAPPPPAQPRPMAPAKPIEAVPMSTRGSVPPPSTRRPSTPPPPSVRGEVANTTGNGPPPSSQGTPSPDDVKEGS